MATRTRLYKVTFAGRIYLVNGYSKSQVCEYIVRKYAEIDISVCKIHDAVDLAAKNVSVEDACNVPAAI